MPTVRKVTPPAAAALAQALAAGQVGAWRAMLQCLNHSLRQAGADADVAGIQQLIANYLVKNALGWQGDEKPEQARKNVGALLTNYAIPVPWAGTKPAAATVCAQTPGDPVADAKLLGLSTELTTIEIEIATLIAGSETRPLATIERHSQTLEQIAASLTDLLEEPTISDGIIEDLLQRIGRATEQLLALADPSAPQLQEVGA